jgi:hypothetical protein
MAEEKTLGAVVDAFPFETYFPATSDTDTRGPLNTAAVERIDERRRLITQHFSSRETFGKYLRLHPLRTLIERRMADAVALHSAALERVDPETLKRITGQSLTEQYRLLAVNDYVNPSSIFPEYPAMANLRELWDLTRAYPDPGCRERKLVAREAITCDQFFRKQWQTLTNEQWSAAGLPSLQRLMRLVAPVPATTEWSEERYRSEARILGHEAAKSSMRGNTKEERSQKYSRYDETAIGTREHPKAQKPTHEGSSSTVKTGTPPATPLPACCDLETIYRLAGAEPQRWLDETADKYTFPRSHEDPGAQLTWGEDIFYDYAVMIPIPERDPTASSQRTVERGVVAAKLSARFAGAILQLLVDQNLAGALGLEVVREMQDRIRDLLARIVPGTDDDSLRSWRRELRELGALCRGISRMRMLFDYDSADLNNAVMALEQALTNMPSMGHRARNVPSELEPPQVKIVDTLEIADVGAPENNIYADVRDYDGEFGVPDAQQAGPEEFYWFWEDRYSNKRLERYVEYLGGTFYDKVTALRDAATQMRDQVNIFAGQSGAVFSEFARLAQGVINDALYSLSRLFDDIAEQLALPSSLEDEGRKRLALMLVYRQHWFPEGYAAGKLVGYKNLLPNQKETMKRRTFIKTTRETTTAQEFATSREEDYSHSSKETHELVKEASSKFDFNINTHGSFDLFIVGGAIDTSTNLNFGSASRAMHSRIAEATEKTSFKYNEKREVKIRNLTETEDVQEITTELQNLNREITANYFYYQLYRQYCVRTELADVRPVLLRAREVPHPAAVDEKFLANNAHVLLHALPSQLSTDLQETVGEIEVLGRTLVRRRVDGDHKVAAYTQFMRASIPADAEGQSRWRVELDSRERAASDAMSALIMAEENYIRARTRIDRVISHVRENLLYYMQSVWQASAKVDQDKLLQKELFNGKPLDQQTLGFSRLGYYGNEEVFEYTGDSAEAVAAMIHAELFVPGTSVIAKAGRGGVPTRAAKENTPNALIERVRKYCCKDDADVDDWILAHVFINDPAFPELRDNSRCVQVAQDALLVETMPGQVPLLEGFQMAHRMLDVQKACLENIHLSERISDRPWERDGQDSYTVVRREGDGDELSVQLGRTDEVASRSNA